MAAPLSDMSFAELYNLRNEPGADQAMLGPFEHKAFAREATQEHPIRAGLAMPIAIPAYTLAKALKLTNSRSPASLDEIFAGYEGYGQGLKNALAAAIRGSSNAQ